jgi:hypothetical protein
MAAERRSLQDRIRVRQQSGFVGRQGQVIQYQENFGFRVDDERRRFLFNIHGDAGVGKTYLTRQLQQIAINGGALSAYVDETVEDVTSVMTVMAEQFARGGARLGEFEKRAAEYPVIADIPLEPFSEAEARQFLASKNVADETTIEVILTLSGRLPLWLVTLAEARPQDQGDPQSLLCWS